MYKIIFSDIDGTLLSGSRTLTQNTIHEVKQLKDKIPFILVSSRMPEQMYHIQKDLGIAGLPLIAYNGGLVLNGEKVLHSTTIPYSILEEVVALNEQEFNAQIHISFYYNDEWYVPANDEWAQREETITKVTPTVRPNREVLTQWKQAGHGAHKLMLMGEETLIERMFKLLNERYTEVMQIYRGRETYIELSDISISKLTGVKIVSNEIYHLPLSEAIAFGDNYNDLEMLKGVGCGVAVANARDEVKAVAKYITLHHSKDGVATFLKQLREQKVMNL
ncbi:HAD family hydrolase [Capnocytophaga ochracea]|jgi:cof-like hydrolase|uniref:Phosphoglycolate phosphatase n=1 Tax=Capnocytophaga ochracea TaxID=1018 RepID=A0A2X2UZT3_CAPOC|nr:HAD family hydrolase [Capnocytophaga ochracea]SQA95000.1 phosphoglycolate phosphatase [Capnocytophaga ochracea]